MLLLLPCLSQLNQRSEHCVHHGRHADAGHYKCIYYHKIPASMIKRNMFFLPLLLSSSARLRRFEDSVTVLGVKERREKKKKKKKEEKKWGKKKEILDEWRRPELEQFRGIIIAL